MISAQFTADFSQFNSATKGAQDAMSGLEKSTESYEASFTKLVASFVTAEAIIGGVKAAWGTLSDLVSSSIASAADAESTQARLTAALQAQGTAVPSVVAAYDAYAQSLQQTTAFSDDQIVAAESMLAIVGGVMPRDMKKALDATTNLASGLKIDLTTATDLVAKAAEGNTTALKKHGVVIDETKAKTEGFGYVLDTINEKFSGQAAAAAATFEGRLAQLANTWDNVKESIGRTITQNATVLKVLELVNTAISENTGELKDNQTAANLVSDVVIVLAKSLSGALAAADWATQGIAQLSDQFQGFTKSTLKDVNAIVAGLQLISTGAASEGYGKLHADIAAKIAELDAATGHATATAQGWHAQIEGMRGGLANMITQLEATRGKTVDTTAATQDGADAWNKNTENVTAANAAAQKLADTQAKIAAATEELISVGASYQDTIAGLNGDMAGAIEYYLQAGVSQSTLATAYQLTDAQVKAVAESLKAQVEAQKQADATAAASEKVWMEYYTAIGAASHDAIKPRVDAAWAAAQAEIDAMERAKTITIADYETIWKTAEQTANNIIQKELEQDPFTRAHFQKVADEAKIAYDRTITYADEYTDTRKQQLRDEYETAVGTLNDWQQAADNALQKVKTPAVQAQQAIEGVTKALNTMQGGTKLPGSYNETIAGQNYLVSPQGNRVPLGPGGTLPDNWFQMYTGQASAPTNAAYLSGAGAYGGASIRVNPWSSSGAPGQQVNVTINGSVLSTQDQMSTMVQDAMMQAYRQGGNLLPV